MVIAESAFGHEVDSCGHLAVGVILRGHGNVKRSVDSYGILQNFRILEVLEHLIVCLSMIKDLLVTT